MNSDTPTPARILIAGGGLVGSSLALAQAGIASTLVEAAPPRAQVPPHEERNLALARASVNGLRAIGVWPLLQEQAQPIRVVRVSRAGAFGSLYLRAADAGVDALGWTVPARALGLALERALAAAPLIERLQPARVAGIEAAPAGWRVRIEHAGASALRDTGLLVAADGSDSALRAQLGIGAQIHDYGQSLIVGQVSCAGAHAGMAHERLGDDGPVALLPLAHGRAGLVLTADSAAATALQALPEADYLALAQRRLGSFPGRLTQAAARQLWPIRRVLATALVAPHAVLVGNAAQTVHPIAAQGFNLGLRDALVLAELLQQAGDACEHAALLADYAARRQADRDGVVRLTHTLATRGRAPLPAVLHSALLTALELPPLRRRLLRAGMGWRAAPPQAVLEPLP